MAVQHPLNKLKALEQELETESGYTGTTRWMIPYADFLTLLLGFFIVLYAVMAQDIRQLEESAVAEQYVAVEEPTSLIMMSTADPDDSLTLGGSVQPSPQESLQTLEDNLLQELGLTGQQVTVSQDDRGVVISFQERIFFDPGKASLSPQAERTLDKLATVLKKAHQPIRVEGHTDNTPIQTAQFPSNWELSTARAVTIVKSLVEKHRFPPQRLSAAGYGEYYPLANNSTIEGKQKNRRVDIVLLNPLPELHTEMQDPPISGQELSLKE